MLLQTATGTIGVIEASWRTVIPEWRVTVHDTAGALEIDYVTMCLRHCPAGGEWAPVEVEDASRFEREIAHFLEVWRGKAKPLVTAEDGIASNRILDAAYRSAGSPVNM